MQIELSVSKGLQGDLQLDQAMKHWSIEDPKILGPDNKALIHHNTNYIILAQQQYHQY